MFSGQTSLFTVEIPAINKLPIALPGDFPYWN